MDTNDNMALLVVKEHITHFRVKKDTDDEYKDLLAWWRAQERHFSYAEFVARKILGVVGS
jgi:DNA-binding sugar fermentation-stimulating protein